MTPERREELRRCEDATRYAAYALDRKNYMATIAAQEERIKALESLLARAGYKISELNDIVYNCIDIDLESDELIAEIDAILPATESTPLTDIEKWEKACEENDAKLAEQVSK